MAKITKTYGELLGLVQTMNALGSNREFAESNTKGMKKLQKVGEKLKSVLEAYNEKLEDIRLDNAHTDDKGCLITDEKGSYKYSKEGTKKLNKEIKALLQESFEFYQFTFSTEGIENYAFLEGWVEGLEFPKAEQSDDEVEVIEETPIVSL
jgi:vacuolar-type H+-ATPase subunit I/STV1